MNFPFNVFTVVSFLNMRLAKRDTVAISFKQNENNAVTTKTNFKIFLIGYKILFMINRRFRIDANVGIRISLQRNVNFQINQWKIDFACFEQFLDIFFGFKYEEKKGDYELGSVIKW